MRCFADAELAWCSRIDNVIIVDLKRVQELNKDDNGKIHPTQKPTQLYKWILDRYAESGFKILDTHVGSASSLIACEEMGFEYVGFELDPEYYQKACERIDRFRSQLTIKF